MGELLMRQCCIKLVLIVLLWQVGSASQGHAAGDGFERASLRGLTAVQVVVEDLAPDIIQDGLTRDHIKQVVEQQLGQGGILVVQQAEHAFYVHLGTARTDTGSYSYALSFQLLQLVMLFRDPGILTWGTTWSFDLVGSFASDNLGALDTLLSRGVNAFIADYQIANSLPE
jgi:hypothetical protein